MINPNEGLSPRDPDFKPRGHRYTILNPDLAEGLKAALPLFDRAGIAHYEVETEDIDGKTRVHITGESGQMDPVEEITTIFEAVKIDPSRELDQLTSVKDRVERRVKEIIENRNNPRIQEYSKKFVKLSPRASHA